MSPNNFTQGHLMEIEWFTTDVTAVGSPDILVGRAILGVVLEDATVLTTRSHTVDDHGQSGAVQAA